MNIYRYSNFQTNYEMMHLDLLDYGHEVDTGHWQSLKDVPHTQTIEVQNVVLDVEIPETMEEAQEEISPNLPWAEDHFQERVGGEPLNPGEQYKNWPWYDPNWAAQNETGKFSHTYMERFWPKYAWMNNCNCTEKVIAKGNRYPYGDLNDVVALLAKEPTTRQAYLPMWFPEDTGAVHGERVPCSLGWHFMCRGDRLHCFYSMRSVDFLRYFRDDVYMAMRLTQWILGQLRSVTSWESVTLGQLSMFISSLHVFQGDYAKMERTRPTLEPEEF